MAFPQPSHADQFAADIDPFEGKFHLTTAKAPPLLIFRFVPHNLFWYFYFNRASNYLRHPFADANLMENADRSHGMGSV
jgi:hypothetical protein